MFKNLKPKNIWKCRADDDDDCPPAIIKIVAVIFVSLVVGFVIMGLIYLALTVKYDESIMAISADTDYTTASLTHKWVDPDNGAN